MASSTARSPRPLAILVGLIVLLLAAGTVAARISGGSAGGARTGGTVRLGDLPPEARQTVALVKAGGPFPYSQDGTVFTNREGLLPAEPSGYYREFTVVTPGAADRGARRIVAGRDGTDYYTDDHYSSFREVVP